MLIMFGLILGPILFALLAMVWRDVVNTPGTYNILDLAIVFFTCSQRII